MKKKALAAIKLLASLLIFVLLFNGVTYILRDKSHAQAILPFYDEPRDSLDVLWYGSSHMINAVMPLELWEMSGITSYNLSQHSQTIPMTYFLLKETLTYQSPKLVVVDVFHSYMDTYYNTESNGLIHETFDNMNFAGSRMEGIFSIVEKERWTEFLFPLYLYHTRWKELKQADFSTPLDVYKGASPGTGITPFDELVLTSDVGTMYPHNEVYLRKIIELCKEKDVPLLLTMIPCVAPYENQVVYNRIKEIAAEYDIAYYDLLGEVDAYGFDYRTDLVDSGHVNLWGAQKITHALGVYISENYMMADHRDDEAYAAWDVALETYKGNRTRILKGLDEKLLAL